MGDRLSNEETPVCSLCSGERYEEVCPDCAGDGEGEMDFYAEPFGGVQVYGCERCEGKGKVLVCAKCGEE